MLGTIDMAGNGLKNVGDLLLPVGSDTVRELGCVDLAEGKGFSLPLGNRRTIRATAAGYLADIAWFHGQG